MQVNTCLMLKINFYSEMLTSERLMSSEVSYYMSYDLQNYVFEVYVCLFVLRFYSPVNPMGSCRARSVYLTTRLLGRLSPLSD